MSIKSYPPLHTPQGSSPTVVPVVELDWTVNGQSLSIGSPSSQSAVFNASNDTVVECCFTTDLWYSVGISPTASTGNPAVPSQFLPSSTVRYVYVPANNVMAFIQNLSSGSGGVFPALTIG